jgi:GTP-binding protein
LSIRAEDGVWIVEGGWMERLVDRVNFSDSESRMYFDRMLRSSGLFERLEAMGIEEGDTVSIYNLDFEYRR